MIKIKLIGIDLGDLFFDAGDVQQSTPKPSPQSTTPPVGSISIPRPPSRREVIINLLCWAA